VGVREFERARRAMVKDQLEARGISDRRVLEAMARLPRERFVGPDQQADAYEDRPLPIGEGQTISQPYMVALMTQCLALEGTERVLELGTGSGYQAAILAELAREVYTVERLRGLAASARTRLESLGYQNLRFRVGDGSGGWPEEAPFDGIVVTAGMPRVSDVLLDQLGEGGRLVAPVGSRSFQELTVVERVGPDLRQHQSGGCTFVPLVGQYGWGGEEGWQ
jgi:protein-L-isoaspartate(D-aspartate) O-methyltransferase